MEAVLAIATILKREGVEYIFNFPDNRILEPAATLGIRPLQARMERTAVGMADGYTRVTNGRKIGVMMAQFGPGIEAAFGGVAAAFGDGTPILVISANMSQKRYGQSPEFDPVPSFREITKWSARLQPDRIPQMMRRAFTLLRTGRPGPVLLDLPLEVGRAEVSDDTVEAYVPVRGARTMASDADVADAVQALLGAKAPVIHAGQGTMYAEATSELRELAELLDIPVMTTLVGKGAFPEDHHLSLGSGGGAWPDAAERFVREADVIFGVGTSFTDSPYSMPVPTDGKVVIQLAVQEHDFNKDRRADILLMGDVKLVLRQILERIGRGSGDSSTHNAERIQLLSSVKQEWEERWAPKLSSDEKPINPYRVIGELMKALDVNNTIITHDAGKPRDQTSPMWKTREPRGYIGWGKSTPLGYGLGLIMGAKMAAPDRFAINIMGDAAIGMSGMDIETAVRLKIPIMTVVLNNGGMTNYEARYPTATERFGFKYLTGDYAGVAEALGATGISVSDPAELRGGIERARRVVDAGGVALLDVRTREEPAVSNHR